MKLFVTVDKPLSTKLSDDGSYGWREYPGPPGTVECFHGLPFSKRKKSDIAKAVAHVEVKTDDPAFPWAAAVVHYWPVDKDREPNCVLYMGHHLALANNDPPTTNYKAGQLLPAKVLVEGRVVVRMFNPRFDPDSPIPLQPPQQMRHVAPVQSFGDQRPGRREYHKEPGE